MLSPVCLAPGMQVGAEPDARRLRHRQWMLRLRAPAGLMAVLGLVWTALALVLHARPPDQPPGGPVVILVSMDGFRADYLQWYRPARLTAFFESGVRAEGLVPVFPAKTFPNHWSLVTG